MSQYTRLFLHFLHAVTDARKRVHSFLFGTRLTNVTRALKSRDPDEALAQCSASVVDWSGGTRIATSLHDFNKRWARRVLTQGAIVLLITDGLERDPDDRLEFEIDRLHRSCRRLIWLNPLLRFEGFEAKARGIRTILPHVDEFRPIHNLDSIGGACAARCRPRGGRAGDPKAVAEAGGVSVICRHRRRDAASLADDDGDETHGLTRTRRRHPESRRGLEGGRARGRARDRGRDLGLGAAAGRLQPGDRRPGQFPRLACRAAASRARW